MRLEALQVTLPRNSMDEVINTCLSTFSTFTLPDWINSISAIAALITAIVTFVTVREMKRQREHSYHPDINIANFEFYAYKYDQEEEDDENIFSIYYSIDKLAESAPKTGYNELTIDINNIGLAVAKQVYWQWFVDFEEIKGVLKQGKNKFIEFDIFEDHISVTAKKINVEWFYLSEEENFSDYFSFILPYSVENRKNTIRIPSSYLDLYWLYRAKEILIDNHSSESKYPPLQLYLKYTDIHGKEIKKSFLLFPRWDFVSNPLNFPSELAKFRFEITEP